jgi:hypothetical protein
MFGTVTKKIEMLYLKNVNGKGRGVFSDLPVLAGSLIEKAPAIPIPADQQDAVSSTVLNNYVYEWDDKSTFAVAGGYGSFYNHSYAPNAKYEFRTKLKEIWIVAVKDIAAGDEILINYNGDPDCQDPLWFEPV